jgi:hypothetical protein
MHSYIVKITHGYLIKVLYINVLQGYYNLTSLVMVYQTTL